MAVSIWNTNTKYILSNESSSHDVKLPIARSVTRVIDDSNEVTHKRVTLEMTRIIFFSLPDDSNECFVSFLFLGDTTDDRNVDGNESDWNASNGLEQFDVLNLNFCSSYFAVV